MASRYWCKVCKRFVDTNLKKKHLASKKHLFNVHDKLREIGLKEREKERLMKLAEDEVGGDDIKHTNPKFKGIRKSTRNGKGARSASHRNTVKSIESSIKNKWVEVTRDNDKSNVEATGVRIRKVSAFDKKLNDWDFHGDDNNEDEDSDEDDDKKQPIRFKIRGRKVRK